MTATASVLLLNAGGHLENPLERISWQRAVKLLFKGKAVLCTTPYGAEYTFDEVTKSGVLSFNTPAVIRLVQWVNPYRKGIRFSRWNVLQRDDMTCQYCARSFSTKNLTLDHITPRCQGGKTTWTNVVAACRRCNQQKGGNSPKESGMHPRNPPLKPDMKDFMRVSLGRDFPDAWRDFLYWNSELEA